MGIKSVLMGDSLCKDLGTAGSRASPGKDRAKAMRAEGSSWLKRMEKLITGICRSPVVFHYPMNLWKPL